MKSRRHFLKTCGAVSLGFAGLGLFTTCDRRDYSNGGYGALQPHPNGFLQLPKGFTCKVISTKGDKMSDGFFVPGLPDGMATFPGKDGRIVLVRNHELHRKGDSAFGQEDELLKRLKPNQLYDYGNGKTPGYGGTTTLVYNPATQTVEQEFLSLAGTIRNCAGGPTPWNSWITCEETVLPKHKFWEKNHGYNFEVPVTEEPLLAKPRPIKGMGRFNHEAVCVDPKTSIVYQTEDREDGLITRYIPKVRGQLIEGGTLQALVIKDQPSMDTRNWGETDDVFTVKQQLEVSWMDLKNIESPKDDLRHRGYKEGAARFARGEGMWFGDNEFYFACTNGGRTKTGQIFRYFPSLYEGTAQEATAPGKLELFAEPNDRKLLQYCDNLTVAPWGDIVVAEDHGQAYLVGINTKGEYYKIAKNVGPGSEFAGITFSPDGKLLFANLQATGLTLVIEGPWQPGLEG